MVRHKIGVLALQGAFESHANVLERLSQPSCLVRTAAELESVDALILPGGESSAMLRLMEAERLAHRVAHRVEHGMPILATCAGVILLALRVEPEQTSLALLDVDVVRNAYGRQLHSSVETLRFEAALRPPDRGSGVFIRAPRIVRVGSQVEILAWLDEDPVLVSQNRILAATYHPELGSDLRVHERFIGLVNSV